MHRPCFLVIDREYPGSISTRKLVIETAKFNVITTYSGHEAIETLDRFPAVDGVVLDTLLEDLSCSEIVAEVKRRNPRLPVIAIHTASAARCHGADMHVESFDPAALLEVLVRLNPSETEEVDRGNAQAEMEQNHRLKLVD